MNTTSAVTPPPETAAAVNWLNRFGEKLPMLHSAFTNLLDTDRWEQSDAATMEQILSSDPGCVARLLRVANSPFFGLNKRVATVHNALTVLGVASARNIALQGCLLDSLGASDGDKLSSEISTHCVVAAVAAHTIAPGMGGQSELAFTAGMLHDVGKIMMLVNARNHVEPIYARNGGDDASESKAEHALFGFDHAALSVLLLERWQLPETIVGAVRHHHQLALCDSPLNRTIFVADQIAHFIDNTHHARESEARMLRDRLNELSISDEQIAQVEDRVAAELASMLGAG